MRIALIGASGRVGSRVLAELVRRGHTVTGIVRDANHASSLSRVSIKAADANRPEQLAPLLASHDAVISATTFVSSNPKTLIASVKQSGVKRFLVVGGAGSLEIAPHQMLVDAPSFPEAYKPESLAGRDFLIALRSEKDLDWTFICPSAEFAPGIRTGKFRIGGDQLLTAVDGRSWISMEDFAIAMVDELEKPVHHQQRFTVGY